MWCLQKKARHSRGRRPLFGFRLCRAVDLLDKLVHADRVHAHAERFIVAALALGATNRASHIVHVTISKRDLEGVVVGNGRIRRHVRRDLPRVGLVGRALNRERAAIGRAFGLEVKQTIKDLVGDHVRLVAVLAELTDLGDRDVGQGRGRSARRRGARSRRQGRQRVRQDVADRSDQVLRARRGADVDVVARGAGNSRPVDRDRRGRAGSGLGLFRRLGGFAIRQDRRDDDVIRASRDRAASRGSGRRRLDRTDSNRKIAVLRGGANGDFGASVSGGIAHFVNSIDGCLSADSVVR